MALQFLPPDSSKSSSGSRSNRSCQSVDDHFGSLTRSKANENESATIEHCRYSFERAQPQQPLTLQMSRSGGLARALPRIPKFSQSNNGKSRNIEDRDLRSRRNKEKVESKSSKSSKCPSSKYKSKFSPSSNSSSTLVSHRHLRSALKVDDKFYHPICYVDYKVRLRKGFSNRSFILFLLSIRLR